MCGIFGFIDQKTGQTIPEMKNILRNMGGAIFHRGPDSNGMWCDKSKGIALGHQRLSVIDLSDAGRQPMESINKRYVLTFNGEIYNHLSIRKQLKLEYSSFPWRGSSDTETLLASIQCWGVDAALEKIVGMFAFALWDKSFRTLTLVRDRMGEKPLYYGWQNNRFMFASELGALRVHPFFEKEIDRNAITLLLKYNAIPAPYSIYKNIYKLMPGSIMKVNFDKSYQVNKKYWDLEEIATTGVASPFSGTLHEAQSELEKLLKNSVADQMIADVPLGAFLSGGIDSSLIVALMQSQSVMPVKTFTIGFHENKYNEAHYAKQIANILGTDHTEHYVSTTDAVELAKKLPSVIDEPFSDSSLIPTYLVSSLARENVTVSLSGDGGDELFGGYNRYFWGCSIWSKIKSYPVSAKKLISSLLKNISPVHWARVYNALEILLPKKLHVNLPEDKIRKLIEILPVKNQKELYDILVSHWKDSEQIVLGASRESNREAEEWIDFNSFICSMMYMDAVTYLPNDILTKVDRAAMAVNLETRIPMLNHHIVEFAWSLPLEFKIRQNQGKWILKQVLAKYIPDNLINRPKMGFGVPLDSWLRGPLRDWADSLLNPTRIKNQNLLDSNVLQKKWNEHLSRKHDWQYHIWDVLVLQAWLDANQ